jgi:Trk K+ transport system NAD-binding subunit
MVDCAGNTVLCGLDTIGFRTLEELRRLDETVVVIDGSTRATFTTRAQALGAVLIEGSYRDDAVLCAAGVERARAFVAVEDDDVGNLHAALAAQELNPSPRVVLRLFDADFARRVERAFGIRTSRSVSALAAPAFAAAALGGEVLAVVPVGPRALVIASSTVAPESQAVGRTVAALESSISGRLLLLTRSGQNQWRPAPDERLAAGDRVVAVTTRAGLASLLQNAGSDARSVPSPGSAARAPRPDT